ncbi:MAG TPA: ATP-binding domain-containing protein [Acidimicrobiales bacterium]|nr:ATP-binding domain-containing protein [Acidimicrobiales bacterium]
MIASAKGPTTTSHPEIRAEQAVVDRAYARLEAMRDAARAVSADVIETTPGGTHQARLERDVRVQLTERRLASLQVGEAGLVFGRTDATGGERRYIGRVAISDEDNEPLVVDWRAPAAEPFYRATPGAPMGLVRRRHFILRGRVLTGLDDELLTAEPPDDDLVLVGEGALLAALERSRSGRMADIVATIQREQDEIVRSPLPGMVVVQGGPGTGKTAVALHRAAYLLYTFRFPLERAGVLLIGPNRIFLRYIEQVLPALGEHTVNLATPADLVPTPVRGQDGPAAVRLKGDARMAGLVTQAVRDRERGLPEPVALLWKGQRVRLTVRDSRRLVEQVKRRRGTHNERRAQMERSVVRHLMGQLNLEEDDGRQQVENGEEGGRDAIARTLRSDRVVVTALERMWPVLTPEELIHDLWGWPALIRLAGRGLLDEEEVAVLHRPRSGRVADVPWTDADLPLLAEAMEHLGPAAKRRRAVPGNGDGPAGWEREKVVSDLGELDPHMRRDLLRHLEALDPRATAGEVESLELWDRTFGHVVIDEAQDLSPMQLRMIGRRVPSGSMTVVGDLGQASGSWAPRSWDEVVAHLPSSERRPARRAELTVNYRTPSEVMDVAARVLAVVAPDLTPSRSVRQVGTDPVFTAVDPVVEGALAAAVRDAALVERAAVPDGKVAVLTAPSMLERVRALLSGSSTAAKGPELLDAALAVLPVQHAKGLEFDSVVVVEPAAIVAEHPHGGGALYLALTRTTRRLRVVSSEALPLGLEATPAGEGTPPVP